MAAVAATMTAVEAEDLVVLAEEAPEAEEPAETFEIKDVSQDRRSSVTKQCRAGRVVKYSREAELQHRITEMKNES